MGSLLVPGDQESPPQLSESGDSLWAISVNADTWQAEQQDGRLVLSTNAQELVSLDSQILGKVILRQYPEEVRRRPGRLRRLLVSIAQSIAASTFGTWCHEWWNAFENPPGTRWKKFRLALFAAIILWGVCLFRGWGLSPYSKSSPFAGNVHDAVLMAIVNFVLVFLLALVFYRTAICQGGLTRGGMGSGSILTRLVLGLGGLAVVATVMIGLFAGSYYRYGHFGDFGDQRVTWVVPKLYDASQVSCKSTDYPETRQTYLVTEYTSRNPHHTLECWVPRPESREAAWYESVSFASTIGGSYTPLSNPARILVAAQMATDLMVLVMLAGILLGVVRPDKDDELTTGRFANSLTAAGIDSSTMLNVRRALGIDP